MISKTNLCTELWTPFLDFLIFLHDMKGCANKSMNSMRWLLDFSKTVIWNKNQNIASLFPIHFLGRIFFGIKNCLPIYMIMFCINFFFDSVLSFLQHQTNKSPFYLSDVAKNSILNWKGMCQYASECKNVCKIIFLNLVVTPGILTVGKTSLNTFRHPNR